MVRLEAVKGLGRIGDVRAVKPLRIMLTDRDMYVAYEAKSALRHLEKTST